MNKKEQIIDVATQLFSEKGFANTSISRICETTKVSKGLVFHHFQSKGHLLREIFARTTEKMMEINPPEQLNLAPRERFRKLLDAFFTQLEADKTLLRFNLNVMFQPTTRLILYDLIEKRAAFLLDSVKSIFEEAKVPDALSLSYLFIAELDGIALNYLCIYDDYPLAQIKKHLIDKYVRNEVYKNE